MVDACSPWAEKETNETDETKVTKEMSLSCLVSLASCPPRHVIIGSSFVRNGLPTDGAFMDDEPAFLAVVIQADGHHQTLAGRHAVAGAIFVHMFGIETERAVIAVAAVCERLDVIATVAAGEWFLTRNERIQRIQKGERIQRDERSQRIGAKLATDSFAEAIQKIARFSYHIPKFQKIIIGDIRKILCQ